jgi:hypothetical protein
MLGDATFYIRRVSHCDDRFGGISADERQGVEDHKTREQAFPHRTNNQQISVTFVGPAGSLETWTL